MPGVLHHPDVHGHLFHLLFQKALCDGIGLALQGRNQVILDALCEEHSTVSPA
jgi:hypothetical protein